ncbi:MAG: NADH-quinone oxidoreductase subunit J [Polyangiaceae bacterium]|jgi:NADH-quinone oxidoreductase subunit J
MISLDVVYFYGLALFAVLGSIGVVVSRHPTRAALGLFVVVISMAALFLPLQAEFLAAIQLIVYAGAIVVLLLFVVMMLGPDAVPASDRRGLVIRALGGALFVAAGGGALLVAARVLTESHRRLPNPAPEAGYGGIDRFGTVLFTDALVPLELSSALLLVAVVGVVAVARGHVRWPRSPRNAPRPLGARVGSRAAATEGPSL